MKSDFTQGTPTGHTQVHRTCLFFPIHILLVGVATKRNRGVTQNYYAVCNFVEKSCLKNCESLLKGHGNEADFLGVSHLWCEHFYRLLSSRCDTEKGGGKGKGHRIDKQNEVNSCALVQPGATWSLMACARRGAPIKTPPPPPHRIMARSWQPRPKSRTASI